MSEPSPSTPEPEHSPTAEPDGSASEPIPEWDYAISVWSWGWDIHWLGIGCLFMLLALYAAWAVISVIRETKRRRRVLSICISLILFLFGLSRGLFLFINPYESPQCHVIPTCPVILTRLMFAVGLPCLTAAFSFVHLLFVQVIKLKVYPAKVQNWKFLLLVVTIHFFLAFVVELIVFNYADWKALSLVCQVFYIVFSILLSTSFLYTGLKIIKHVNRTSRHVNSMGQRSVGRFVRRRLRPYTPNVSKLVKITYLTASLGVISCALQLYSIFAIYDMYRSENVIRPKPVPWLVFQTMFRLVELGAGMTMAYVSPKQTKEWSHELFPCISCCKTKIPKPVACYSGSGSGGSNASHKMKILDLQTAGQSGRD